MSHQRNRFYLQGTWLKDKEAIRHARQTENYEDYIALKFTGTSVNAVIDPEKTASFGVQVTIDGRPLDPSVAGADLATADGLSFVTGTGASCTRWSLCPSSANMS